MPLWLGEEVQELLRSERLRNLLQAAIDCSVKNRRTEALPRQLRICCLSPPAGNEWSVQFCPIGFVRPGLIALTTKRSRAIIKQTTQVSAKIGNDASRETKIDIEGYC